MIPQDQIEEINRSHNDPVYFIDTHVKTPLLISPTDLRRCESVDPFKLRDPQKRIINEFHTHNLNICCAPRRFGKTMLLAAYALHYAIFNSNVAIGVLSYNYQGATDIIWLIKKMHTNLPTYLQHNIVESTKDTIVFESGSSITISVDHGNSFDLLIYDDFAHARTEKADWFVDVMLPIQLAGMGKCIIMSTPSGTKHKFYKLYSDAINGSNNFNPIKVTWDDIPGRDQKFKEWMLAHIGQNAWKQQYECEFVDLVD
jgi:hypothetical protein